MSGAAVIPLHKTQFCDECAHPVSNHGWVGCLRKGEGAGFHMGFCTCERSFGEVAASDNPKPNVVPVPLYDAYTGTAPLRTLGTAITAAFAQARSNEEIAVCRMTLLDLN